MLGGRTPTQRAVRSLRVVALPPVRNEPPGIGEAAKPLHREALVTKFAVEALQMPVLHGLARIAEIQDDAMLIGPDSEHRSRKFGAVVQRDALGGALPEDELVE